jgi:very-short-patch-repair endonuclease
VASKPAPNQPVSIGEFAASVCESPIENKFLVALNHHCGEVGLPLIICANLKDISKEITRSSDPRIVGIAAQVVWLEYRMDFLVGARVGENIRWLAIECDGHDFHERTKKQAAYDRRKDRRIQASGMNIFRFTGSEIWPNGGDCALEIISWVKAIRE